MSLERSAPGSDDACEDVPTHGWRRASSSSNNIGRWDAPVDSTVLMWRRPSIVTMRSEALAFRTDRSGKITRSSGLDFDLKPRCEAVAPQVVYRDSNGHSFYRNERGAAMEIADSQVPRTSVGDSTSNLAPLAL